MADPAELIAVCDRLARAAMTAGGTDGPDPELIAAHEAYSAHRGAIAAILGNQIPTPPAGMHYELVKDGTTPRQRANHKRHSRHIAIIMNKTGD